MNKGFSLALQGKSFPSFKQEDELYAGDTINLFFEFPNGKAIKLSFKQGQDVEWAKNVVQDRTGLSRSDFKLFFENKQMIEILSLSDIPNLKDGSKVQVVVNENVEFNFDQIA
ncbi:ubiquitin family protein (macronuclear) [Tetrahymena thermophila SB210]|uniref:Ubiquitin family protein n=1 Tax=Tetrahymena thermophila (strain SB210) TaxID=312017 RepID=Q22YU2_TETTS|nr:ubiquitin family protein [Tetrahymena thermophila SB210]EAR90579.3 ubiquitin family protein [Tetrahymena thermophila SB210]|eukprot:XP_001010824.3 ubiquitin family protein [Tetrahymena thermophila SB210]